MTTTRILVAPDKFKESLTGIEAAHLIKQGINEIDPHAEVIAHPVADRDMGVEHVWQLRSPQPDLARCLHQTSRLLPELATTAYTWWRSR